MCNFISWKEFADGTILFLTADDIFNSKRGRELQQYTPQKDWIGHGAIKFYYEITRPCRDRECEDFSTPANFPAEIAAALKAGRFRGLGTPKQLLTQQAWAEYVKVEQQAWAEYVKVEQQAWAEYVKVEQQAWPEYVKVQQPAWAEYVKVEQQAWPEYVKVQQQAWPEYVKVQQPAWAEYEKVERSARAEYVKVKQQAWAEYVKVEQQAFWDLFAYPLNRPEVWR